MANNARQILESLREVVKSLDHGDFGLEIGAPPNADDIKEMRKLAGLTQAEFSSRLGVSVETVRSWEMGRRHPGKVVSRVLAGYRRSLEPAE